MKTNKVLADQLNSSNAVKFRRDISKALYEQWVEIIHSEDLGLLYSKYKGFVIKSSAGYNSLEKKFVEDKSTFQDINIFDADKDKENRPKIARGAVLAAVSVLLAKRFIPLEKIPHIKDKTTGYINSVMNKGGQNIVSAINPKINFRLSKAEYKAKLTKRFSTMTKDLDKTTKRKMVNAIVDGLGKDITKQELHTKLIDAGKLISKSRAELIAKTESLAAYEYMKQETAKLNGATNKVWRAMGTHACPDCEALDGATEPIDEDFKGFGIKFPPLHPQCECGLEYPLEVSKAEGSSIINPEAVWAGGESLVGRDKAIGLYYKQIQEGVLKLEDTKPLLSELGFKQLSNRLTKFK